jgi:hypothetical protein
VPKFEIHQWVITPADGLGQIRSRERIDGEWTYMVQDQDQLQPRRWAEWELTAR